MLKRLSQASKKTQGFSLVELIVVIALLGMLMLLMVSNYGKFFSSSKEKIAKMLLENLEAPLLLYMNDVGSYPTTEEGLQALLKPPARKKDRWNGPYIKKPEALKDPWKNQLQYCYPGRHNPDSYDLWSKGPGGRSGDGDDIGNWETTEKTEAFQE